MRMVNTMMETRQNISWLLAALILLSISHTATASEVDPWQALNKGEAVALMRHAIAPGNGDPPEFDVSDCATQRNLSKDGQLQAQQIGLQLRERGIKQADVYASQWCRCVDTAHNLEFGTVQTLPMLNSFYQNRATKEQQTTQLLNWITNRLAAVDTTKATEKTHSAPAILVTHQVNITALTGVFPSSGEVVIVTVNQGQVSVLASWIAEF